MGGGVVQFFGAVAVSRQHAAAAVAQNGAHRHLSTQASLACFFQCHFHRIHAIELPGFLIERQHTP